MNRDHRMMNLQLPVVLKLVRRGAIFSCSLCKSEFESSAEANSCLERCWTEVKALHPVVRRRGPLKTTVYRCHFCCRDYSSDDEALSCAKLCLDRWNSLRLREQILTKIKPTPAPRRTKLSQVTQGRSIFARKFSQQGLPSDSIELMPSPAIKDSPDLEAVPDGEANLEAQAPDHAAPLGKASPRKARSKMSFAKPWVRHNAKYKCCCCNILFFTRMEAEECFKAHFDEEGFEIEKAKED